MDERSTNIHIIDFGVRLKRIWPNMTGKASR